MNGLFMFMNPPSYNNPQAGFNPLQMMILLVVVIILLVAVVSAYVSAQATARDAQRVSDIVQLEKALKIYYQEFGVYPQHSVTYQAVGIDNSFARFVSPWPEAPSADGMCTDEYNRYKYEQFNGGESYQLRFCLGDGYGQLKAGVHVLTPTGVR